MKKTESIGAVNPRAPKKPNTTPTTSANRKQWTGESR